MLIYPNEIIHPDDLQIVKFTGNFPTHWEIQRKKRRWFREDVWVTAMSSYNKGAYCGNPWKLTYITKQEANEALKEILLPFHLSKAKKEIEK